jgi:hypothetical protein
MIWKSFKPIFRFEKLRIYPSAYFSLFLSSFLFCRAKEEYFILLEVLVYCTRSLELLPSLKKKKKKIFCPKSRTRFSVFLLFIFYFTFLDGGCSFFLFQKYIFYFFKKSLISLLCQNKIEIFRFKIRMRDLLWIFIIFKRLTLIFLIKKLRS